MFAFLTRGVGFHSPPPHLSGCSDQWVVTYEGFCATGISSLTSSSDDIGMCEQGKRIRHIPKLTIWNTKPLFCRMMSSCVQVFKNSKRCYKSIPSFCPDMWFYLLLTQSTSESQGNPLFWAKCEQSFFTVPFIWYFQMATWRVWIYNFIFLGQSFKKQCPY